MNRSIRRLLVAFLILCSGHAIAFECYQSKKQSIKGFFNPKDRYPEYYWIKLHDVDSYLPSKITAKRWSSLLNNPVHPLRHIYQKILAKKKFIGHKTGLEFFNYLKPLTRYTYIISDQWLIVANVMTNPPNKYSKHMVVAGFLPDVRYAGELMTAYGMGHTIQIDNNSGTYQPHGDDLIHVANLLRGQLNLSVITKEYK